ncbi:MAG: Flp1 family type IVb pilin [Lachnospiraceae bacterium]
MKKGLKEFFYEEDGIGTVEMILIMVVLILVVTIFRGKIEKLVGDIFLEVDKCAEKVWKES